MGLSKYSYKYLNWEYYQYSYLVYNDWQNPGHPRNRHRPHGLAMHHYIYIYTHVCVCVYI